MQDLRTHDDSVSSSKGSSNLASYHRVWELDQKSDVSIVVFR